jgi:predicted ATP-grasp superfamily ATP-dependent carboligase
MTTVLVLDAENKNALAAIRALGRRGMKVVSASPKRLTRGGVSKYSTASVVYPAPDNDEKAFIAVIVETVDRMGVDVVLPIGDASTRTLSRHQAVINAHAATCLAAWDAMRLACFKQNTFPLARRLGIPVPRTYKAPEDVGGFPVVVKKSVGSGGVRYVKTPEELARIDTSDALIQEYVPGDGYGLFALFERGRERAVFMHRRIREYPITGGASTAAESFYDPGLRDLGLTLLRALNWHGVAMVEFKKDRRDGAYKLMEINAKFWGSLDLAIAAGVDFPWLAVKMALGELAEDVTEYRVGLRFHWVFDDLMHLAARPSSFPELVRDFRLGVENDIFLDDVRPAVLESARTIASLVRRIATSRLRYPHGNPA